MKFRGALALLLLAACSTPQSANPPPSQLVAPEVVLSSHQMSDTLQVSQINKIRAISPNYIGYKVATQYRPDYLVVVYCAADSLCNTSVPTWEHPHFAFALTDEFSGTPSEKLRPTVDFIILFPAQTARKHTWCWPHNVGYLYDNMGELLEPLSHTLQHAVLSSYKRTPYKIAGKTFWCKIVSY